MKASTVFNTVCVLTLLSIVVSAETVRYEMFDENDVPTGQFVELDGVMSSGNAQRAANTDGVGKQSASVDKGAAAAQKILGDCYGSVGQTWVRPSKYKTCGGASALVFHNTELRTNQNPVCPASMYSNDPCKCKGAGTWALARAGQGSPLQFWCAEAQDRDEVCTKHVYCANGGQVLIAGEYQAKGKAVSFDLNSGTYMADGMLDGLKPGGKYLKVKQNPLCSTKKNSKSDYDKALAAFLAPMKCASPNTGHTSASFADWIDEKFKAPNSGNPTTKSWAKACAGPSHGVETGVKIGSMEVDAATGSRVVAAPIGADVCAAVSAKKFADWTKLAKTDCPAPKSPALFLETDEEGDYSDSE